MFRRSGRSYGNATKTIANDPDDRLDRIEFYPDDRDDRVNFESPASLAIVWVAFPYDRPDRLNIFFWDDYDNPDDSDDSDDHMETRLKHYTSILEASRKINCFPRRENDLIWNWKNSKCHPDTAKWRLRRGQRQSNQIKRSFSTL